MVSDLRLGAVLPPVVIGAVISNEEFKQMPIDSATSITEALPAGSTPTLSIIDGMQRTAAIIEAVKEDSTVAQKQIRVEFWFANSVRAMIYRMLVLNTGQVPWTMSRQLSVVYAPLLQEIRENVPELEKMHSPDNPGRRVGAAQFSSEHIVELYIAFSLRKTTVDTKEAVSDEFSRLDFVDNLSDSEFQHQFYGTLSMLALLDKAFSRYSPDGASGRMMKGRNIFDSQPARIGFIVSVGIAVLGRPGADRTPEQRSSRLAQHQDSVHALISKLEGLSESDLGDFLRLDVLREVLDRRVGQVGRYERAVFSEAFKVLVEEEFTVTNLEQCWRAN
ncbi:hypothetical protein GS894_06955 [Rhodococcus hoagii]|uniref:hypothetical protein n=1 Tax=Rhodococcus hoagii TaxID=43767 RepID=UPI0013019002|nr:hypothetical protein [Prescottella equi]MDP8016229.1 hypothetical protein [Prescottella equi]NKR85921.1 hypothetical protein [Prescottella equi]NKS05933.1 hypothetical protein [Prescottella equi]NKS94771.1 hypothetical protein [Prescottella equi]NKT08157.1 hypothetical protein [Prescottella equi]